MREPGPALTIRLAADSDVPVLQAIAAAAYQLYVPRIGRPPAPMTADYADIVERGQAWLATERAITGVSARLGEPVGHVSAGVSEPAAGVSEPAAGLSVGSGELTSAGVPAAALAPAGAAQPAVGAGTQAAGLIVLVPADNYLLLENVAVVPSAQGRGVGGALLRFAEDHARSLGLSEIRLYTNAAMTENLAYYPRRGYRETGRREQDGFSRVFFAKQV